MDQYEKAVLQEAGYTEQQIHDIEFVAEGRRTRDEKQANIPAAAAASESGKVVGSVKGSGDVDSLTAELNALRKQPATAQSMKQRIALRKQLEASMPEHSVTFDRN